jgi:hypothetical protein
VVHSGRTQNEPPNAVAGLQRTALGPQQVCAIEAGVGACLPTGEALGSGFGTRSLPAPPQTVGLAASRAAAMSNAGGASSPSMDEVLLLRLSCSNTICASRAAIVVGTIAANCL